MSYEQFSDPAFSVESLTASINDMPFVPGQVGNLEIFDEDGVATTTVKVEKEGDVLSVIEPTPRGGPGETIGEAGRDVIPFEMDHFEINDSVMADEVQGVRAFGTDNELETLQSRVDTKLGRHARSMDATLEHQRVGALKGLVTSRSGKTLHDLYTRFDIAIPAAVNMGIDSDVTGLAGKIKGDVILSIEDDLDEMYSGVHAFCGTAFHTALFNQKEVRETFVYHSGASVLRDEIPDVFRFAGVTWERYRTGRRAKAAIGGSNFIADDEARVFPMGVPGLFGTWFGPADYEETVNTIGLPRYARQYGMPNGKGRHLDSQMNSISLCTRPGVLRRLTLT